MRLQKTVVLAVERQALADRHQAAAQPIKETTAVLVLEAQTFRPRCKLAVVEVLANPVILTAKVMEATV
jgi:hypothetical protein